LFLPAVPYFNFSHGEAISKYQFLKSQPKKRGFVRLFPEKPQEPISK
jgi:hypothetical protein